MFERDRDPRRDDREIDVQDEERGSAGGTKRTGSRDSGSSSGNKQSGNRSGSSSQKKK